LPHAKKAEEGRSIKEGADPAVWSSEHKEGHGYLWDEEFLVTLDTGASINILSKEVVDPRHITGVIICVNGTPMPLEEDKVKLSVEGMEWSCCVGVAPSRLIGGSGLLSFDLDSEEP